MWKDKIVKKIKNIREACVGKSDELELGEICQDFKKQAKEGISKVAELSDRVADSILNLQKGKKKKK